MRRAQKKKTVKKKVATKAPAKKQKSPTPDEFDAWASSQKGVSPGGCSVCREDDIVDTVALLLNAMVRKRAHRITVKEIYGATVKRHPTSDVGQRGMERHLRVCVRPLYNRARGRKNV
jgi:hypothetical protein